MELDFRQEERKKEFKGTPSINLIANREEYALKLRKNKRQTEIVSKRMLAISEYPDNPLEEEAEKIILSEFSKREPLLGDKDSSLVLSLLTSFRIQYLKL